MVVDGKGANRKFEKALVDAILNNKKIEEELEDVLKNLKDDEQKLIYFCYKYGHSLKEFAEKENKDKDYVILLKKQIFRKLRSPERIKGLTKAYKDERENLKRIFGENY